MSKIRPQEINGRNTYSRRYEQLGRSILDAATAAWDDLDVAAIELVEGYFEIFDRRGSGCPNVWSNHEALRHLHENGVLDQELEWFVTPKMRRHDVAFGLALHENEAANFLLGESVAAHGWSQEDAQALGLRAAISATECYMWGVALRDQGPANHPRKRVDAKCRSDDAPELWVFRSSCMESQPDWRQPRIVWAAPEYLTPGRPMPRPLRKGSRQLRAVASTIAYLDAVRSGQQAELTTEECNIGVDVSDHDSYRRSKNHFH